MRPSLSLSHGTGSRGVPVPKQQGILTDLLMLGAIFACAAAGLVLISRSVPTLETTLRSDYSGPANNNEADSSLSSSSSSFSLDESDQALFLPNNLEDVQRLYRILRRFMDGHFMWLLSSFAYVYVFKQTFSIPGSAFMNVIAGAVFGLTFGFPLVCFLTASGASCCYWLSNFFGRRLSRRLLSEKIDKFQAVVEQEAAQNNLFPYLLFARIFPMSPNFLLNLASPLVGVPFRWFFISVLFGLMPYNFFCVQAGTIVSELKSMEDVMSASVLLKLGVLAVSVLIFTLISNRYRNNAVSTNDAIKTNSKPEKVNGHRNGTGNGKANGKHHRQASGKLD